MESHSCSARFLAAFKRVSSSLRDRAFMYMSKIIQFKFRHQSREQAQSVSERRQMQCLTKEDGSRVRRSSRADLTSTSSYCLLSLTVYDHGRPRIPRKVISGIPCIGSRLCDTFVFNTVSGSLLVKAGLQSETRNGSVIRRVPCWNRERGSPESSSRQHHSVCSFYLLLSSF
jgi:hypothetical protein